MGELKVELELCPYTGARDFKLGTCPKVAIWENLNLNLNLNFELELALILVLETLNLVHTLKGGARAK